MEAWDESLEEDDIDIDEEFKNPFPIDAVSGDDDEDDDARFNGVLSGHVLMEGPPGILFPEGGDGDSTSDSDFEPAGGVGSWTGGDLAAAAAAAGDDDDDESEDSSSSAPDVAIGFDFIMDPTPSVSSLSCKLGNKPPEGMTRHPAIVGKLASDALIKAIFEDPDVLEMIFEWLPQGTLAIIARVSRQFSVVAPIVAARFAPLQSLPCPNSGFPCLFENGREYRTLASFGDRDTDYVVFQGFDDSFPFDDNDRALPIRVGVRERDLEVMECVHDDSESSKAALRRESMGVVTNALGPGFLSHALGPEQEQRPGPNDHVPYPRHPFLAFRRALLTRSTRVSLEALERLDPGIKSMAPALFWAAKAGAGSVMDACIDMVFESNGWTGVKRVALEVFERRCGLSTKNERERMRRSEPSRAPRCPIGMELLAVSIAKKFGATAFVDAHRYLTTESSRPPRAGLADFMTHLFSSSGQFVLPHEFFAAVANTHKAENVGPRSPTWADDFMSLISTADSITREECLAWCWALVEANARFSLEAMETLFFSRMGTIAEVKLVLRAARLSGQAAMDELVRLPLRFSSKIQRVFLEARKTCGGGSVDREGKPAAAGLFGVLTDKDLAACSLGSEIAVRGFAEDMFLCGGGPILCKLAKIAKAKTRDPKKLIEHILLDQAFEGHRKTRVALARAAKEGYVRLFRRLFEREIKREPFDVSNLILIFVKSLLSETAASTSRDEGRALKVMIEVFDEIGYLVDPKLALRTASPVGKKIMMKSQRVRSISDRLEKTRGRKRKADDDVDAVNDLSWERTLGRQSRARVEKGHCADKVE
jgi:hypothetical protein